MSSDGRTLGVLISGRGTNLQAILDAIKEGRLDARVGVVVSNRGDAQGLERARKADVPTSVIDHKAFASREAFDERVLEELRKYEVDVVCLAGFMRLLSPVLSPSLSKSHFEHPSCSPACVPGSSWTTSSARVRRESQRCHRSRRG